MTSGALWEAIPVHGWEEYLRDFKNGNGSSDWNPFYDLEVEGHHELAFCWRQNHRQNLDSRHIRLFHYGSNWLGSDDAGLMKFSIKDGFKVQISLIPETYLATESRYFDSAHGDKWNFCEIDSRKEEGLYRGNSPPPRELLMYGNGRTGYKQRYYSCMTFEMVQGDELVLDVADDFRGSGGGTEVYKLTVQGQNAGWKVDDDIDVNVVVSITGISIASPQESAGVIQTLKSVPDVVDTTSTPIYTTKSLEDATLRRGNRGSNVRELQRLLNLLGLVDDVDGIFGKKTEAAVIRLQSLMVNYGGYAATRYENGVFNPNLYEDIQNFDPSHLTISDCKIKTLEQYHNVSDPRDPFSRFEVKGTHSFDSSGAELSLESNSSIRMKIRDNWAIKVKILVENYDYFPDNLMHYTANPNIFSCHNPSMASSYVELKMSGGDELIFDVSNDYPSIPNFFLKLQGFIVSQNAPETVGGIIRIEVVDVMTPQNVWVRYRTEKPVIWGRDYGDNFWDYITDALSISEHLNNLGVNSTVEYGVSANVAVEFKVDAEQVFVIKNLDGTKYSLESTYKAGVGVEAGSTKFGFGQKKRGGTRDKTKAAIADVGLGFSGSASIYGSWSTVYEFPDLDSLKDSIYYFLLGPAYSVIYPVKIAIDSYSFATGSYSRKGDKLSVGLMAEGSAVANFVLNNNGTNENALVHLGGQLGLSGSISGIYDLDYDNKKLSVGFEIERVGSVSAGASLGFMSGAEEGNGITGKGDNIFKFGLGGKVEVITHSITYNSMDANEPLEPFTDSDSKLSFDLSTKIGPLQLSSPMEQIKLTFDVSSKNRAYEIVLDIKTSFEELINFLIFMRDSETCLLEKLKSMANVITDISLEINKIVTSGFGNLGLEVKVLGVGGGVSVTQKETHRTSLFEDLSGNSLTYTPDSTLSSIDKIQAVKNKLLGVFSRHFKDV